MLPSELMRLASQARLQAYCPYSGFSVGAALLCGDGEVVTGCNVENASYPLGNCAERTAVFTAIAKGKRNFSALAISGGPVSDQSGGFCPPCGACRQVLREFCSEDFPIFLSDPHGEIQTFLLGQLLPVSFGPEFSEKTDTL